MNWRSFALSGLLALGLAVVAAGCSKEPAKAEEGKTHSATPLPENTPPPASPAEAQKPAEPPPAPPAGTAAQPPPAPGGGTAGAPAGLPTGSSIKGEVLF